MAFKVGDVVRLKSGSHDMTVAYVDKEKKTVNLVFFGSQQLLHVDINAMGLAVPYTQYGDDLIELNDIPFGTVVGV